MTKMAALAKMGKDFAALWVGMVVCVPTYTMASSMLDQGFTLSLIHI